MKTETTQQAIKDGSLIRGSYYFGDDIHTGIGYVKSCGRTLYAYLALDHGGVTVQELYSLRDYKLIEVK